MKTIYISGPITDQKTGLPREGWQQDFLDAEAKLRRMGFQVINPVDIAREVDDQNMYRWEYMPRPCTSDGEPLPPSRADYIMACLQRMKMNRAFGRLDGVYVIGKSQPVVVRSHGVQMEVLLAEVLGVPVYAEIRDDRRVCSTYMQVHDLGTIGELLQRENDSEGCQNR